MTPVEYLSAKNEVERCQKAVEVLVASRANSAALDEEVLRLTAATTALEKLIDDATVDERQAVAFM